MQNLFIYVTRHEKTGLMYTKYTYSYYSTHLLYCIRFAKSIRHFLLEAVNDENCVHVYTRSYLINFETTFLYICILAVSWPCWVTYTYMHKVLRYLIVY